MERKRILAILVAALGLLVWLAGAGEAGPVGTAFTYQGRLIDANSAADGLYDFAFKLYDANVGGGKVGNDVNLAEVDVIDGYFTVELDFGSDVFDGDAMWLEIGVRPGELEDPNVYTLLSPRQQLRATPYAIYAMTASPGNTLDASDGNPKDAVYVDNVGDVGIGTIDPVNLLHLHQGGGGYPVLRMSGTNYVGTNGALIRMVNTDGSLRLGAATSLDDLTITPAGRVGIGTTSPGEKLHVVGNAKLVDSSANDAVVMKADGLGSAGQISMYDYDGTETVRIVAAESTSTGAEIALRKADGTTSIWLDADFNGDGRISTDELVITGGSDLSEQFDIAGAEEAVKAGMLVCIDAKNPGKLVVSTNAYDKKVAGIISGAGGIKPGMMMGQKDTAADGVYAVALTGRVYCWADASAGAIEPGDLLTTSDVPGHAMKVSEHNRALGAIIGKAMTLLQEGKGLVLVLVSLQ